MKSICIFEDGAYQNFLPLAYSRPVYELRCGIYSFLERIILYYPDTEINLFCREYLKNLVSENYSYSVNKIKSNKSITLDLVPTVKICDLIKIWNPGIKLIGFKAVYKQKEKAIIEGADHGLRPKREELYKIVVNWFKEHLK